jgi:spermidine dehydrogenase
LIIGYGGSESMQSPKGLYSSVAKGLLKELGVDIARFETAFERRLYPSLGLSRGVFFPRETFGRDVLVTGDPRALVADELSRALSQRQATRRLHPVPGVGCEQGATDRALSAKQRSAQSRPRQKTEILKRTSYRDYLVKIAAAGGRSPTAFRAHV